MYKEHLSIWFCVITSPHTEIIDVGKVNFTLYSYKSTEHVYVTSVLPIWQCYILIYWALIGTCDSLTPRPPNNSALVGGSIQICTVLVFFFQLQMSRCWWINAREIWFHFYSHPSLFSPMTVLKVFSFRQTWRHFSNKSWEKTVLQHAWHDPEQLDFFFWLLIRCHDTRNIYYSDIFFTGLFNMYPFNTIKN